MDKGTFKYISKGGNEYKTLKKLILQNNIQYLVFAGIPYRLNTATHVFCFETMRLLWFNWNFVSKIIMQNLGILYL